MLVRIVPFFIPQAIQDTTMTTRRSDIVLAAMAPASAGTVFDPVRMQKLLFLIDKEIPDLIGGPYFNFQPYNYGPFDVAVYTDLETLTKMSFVHTDRTWHYLRYRLSGSGRNRGTTVLASLPERASHYIERACSWILMTDFADLLSAIYRRYPEMTVNTVVPQFVPRSSHKMQSAGNAFLTGLARSIDCMGSFDETSYRLSDAEAIADAWQRTGDDIRTAMEKCTEQEIVE